MFDFLLYKNLCKPLGNSFLLFELMKNLKDKHGAYRHILRYISLFGSVQALSMLIGLVRIKVAALFLNAYGMGVSSILNSTVSLLANVSNMGLPVSGVHAISEEMGKNEKATLSETICLIRSLCLMAALVGMLFCALLSPVINSLTFAEDKHVLDFIVLSPVIALTTLLGGELAVLKATRQLRSIAMASLLGVIASLVISAPIYYIWGVQGIVPVIGLMAFVQWLVTLHYSCRYYPLRYSFSLKVLRKGKGIIKLGAAFVMATMLNSLAEFLIRSFLCQAGDLRTVGLFNAAITLSIGYTGVVFTSLESDYFPRLSAIAGKKEEWTMCVNRQREVNVLLVGPMLVLFIFVLPMMVPLLYSSDFVDMTRMAQLAAVGVFFKASYAPMEYLPLAKGEPKVYFWQESLAVLLLFFSEVIGFLLGGLTGLGAGILVANGLELLAVSCFCRYYYGYHSSEKSVKYGVGQVILLLMTLFLVFCSDDSRMLLVFAFVVLLVSGLLSYRSIVKNL